jgi:phosphoglycerate dehydrogenase-like enzyme
MQRAGADAITIDAGRTLIPGRRRFHPRGRRRRRRGRGAGPHVSARAANNGALRVGVVGVGHLGKHHARLLAAMPDVQLVGVADLVEERARAATAGTSAEVFADAAACSIAWTR